MIVLPRVRGRDEHRDEHRFAVDEALLAKRLRRSAA